MSRQGIMLAKPYTERLLDKMTIPYLLQRKINGERSVAYITEDDIQLRSSELNLFETVPHIVEELKRLDLPPGIYDGELYRHGWKLQDIHSVVSTVRKQLHPDYKEITYQVFDTNIQGLKQLDRTEWLNNLLTSKDLSPIIERVHTYGIEDKRDIPEMIKIFMNQGYEGGIIRNKDGLYELKKTSSMLKIKPREIDEYIIVGSLEEMTIHGEPKNALGSFICAKDNQTFKVGTGRILTRANRERFWRERDKLIGRTLVVKYQELTTRGVPFCNVAYDIK